MLESELQVASEIALEQDSEEDLFMSVHQILVALGEMIVRDNAANGWDITVPAD
jgi:hypothetical protein